MRKSPQADVFRPCGSDRNAHINGRAFGQQKNPPHRRAHIQIQAGRAARTIRSKTVRVVSILSGFTFIQNRARENFAPNPYLRVSTADREMSAAAFRPKKIPSGSFLHVSAYSTSPRLSPGKVRGSREMGIGNWQREPALFARRPPADSVSRTKESKGFAFQKVAPRAADFNEIRKAEPFDLLPAPPPPSAGTAVRRGSPSAPVRAASRIRYRSDIPSREGWPPR